jgi:hypothetical protein
VPGTENGDGLFFSTDGRWLGFEASGKLMKISLQGGGPLSGSRLFVDGVK